MSHKSFLLNFDNEIQKGIAIHKNKMEKATAIPNVVPKKSLKIAPV